MSATKRELARRRGKVTLRPNQLSSAAPRDAVLIVFNHSSIRSCRECARAYHQPTRTKNRLLV